MEGDKYLNRVGIKVFVNALTVFRCFFTFAMPFLINRVPNNVFLIIIVVLYFTDWMDGFISRKCKVQTLFGSVMDTIADKILCIVLILCIANTHFILYAIMIGEILIAVMNMTGILNGATIVAIMAGKAKMWALALTTIIGYMYYFNICGSIFVIISGVLVLVMQIVVIFGYGNKIRKVKQLRNEKVKFKRGEELKYALFNTEYYLNTIDEPLLKKLTVS